MKRQFVGILAMVILLFTACDDKNKEDINIGFIAGLSGKYSTIGIDTRNGFLLAFDEIDYKINNQKINIIAKDDKQDKIEAKKAIKDLIDANVKLVVGNATSSMTAVTLPIVNQQKNMLLISATASSNEFSKKEDNFLRVQIGQSRNKFSDISQYLVRHGLKNIIFLYDSRNMSYIKGFQTFFQDVFVEKGGNKFVDQIDLNSPYKSIIKKIKKQKHDIILVAGNSIDSANIIQYLRVHNINSQIVASGWAKTMDFIKNGGKTIEGVLFSANYNENSKNQNFKSFVQKYEKKYHKKPSNSASQGYELAKIVIENLTISSDMRTLKKRILAIKQYDGLQGKIIFDKYGDVYRESFIMEIKDKKFVKIQ